MKKRYLATLLVVLIATVMGAGALSQMLHVGSVSGSLLSGLTFTDVDVRVKTLSLHAARLRLLMRLGELWQGRLHIETLAIDGLNVRDESPPDTHPRSFDLKTIPLPLGVVIDDLSLHDGVWQRPGHAPVHIQHLNTALSVDRTGLDIRAASGETTGLRIHASGHWHPAGQPPITLDLAWRLEPDGGPALEGQGTAQGDGVQWHIQQTVQQPVLAEVQADVRIQPDGPHGSARIELPTTPLNRFNAGLPDWPVRGVVRVDHQATALHLNVEGAFEAPHWGVVASKGQFEYTPEGSLRMTHLDLKPATTDSRLNLEGVWHKDHRFQLKGGWNTLTWPPEKPWIHSDHAAFSLSGQPEDMQAEWQGVIQQHPLTATARLGIVPKRFEIRQLQVRGANTRLDLDGHLGDTLALNWTLNAAQLGTLLDGAKGGLDSQGRISGSIEHPDIDMKAKGEHLAFGEYGVAHLELNASTRLRADAPVRVHLRLNDAYHGNERFDLAVQADGTTRRHTLDARVTHPRYPLWLEGEGGWNDTDWHGDLRRVDFSHPLLGAWRVQAPASINLGIDGFKLGDTCWQSGSALWCAAARRVGERFEVDTRLSGLPLAQLMAAPPKNLTVTGMLQAQASVSGRGTHPEEGRFELGIPNLAMLYRTPSTRVWQFRPEQAELKGSLHQGIAQFKLMLKDSAFADLSGELSTRTTADLPLSGQFRLNLPDLSVLEAREAHQPAQIEGLGQLDAEVGGTLHTPKLTLRGGITQASLSLPSLGLHLTDMALSLKPASDPPNRVEITGQARSGAGRIHLTGQAGLDAAQGWPWSVSLSGHNVQVSNTRMAEVTLDPQLHVEGNHQGIRLSGVATIPHARIVLPDYSVVKISPDTIRVGQTEAENSKGLSLSSEVEVHLGEDVRFEGGGVNAKINGQLKIEQAAHEPGHASGEIRIKEGDYTFHTVKLPLTGGRLIYHHAALDNPELDFNVLREVDGIRAGIRVLGPLQKPGFNLYSDPVMPESDILAYIISGKSLNLSSRQEGQIMQQAAASLSGPVGNLILREVTGRFGLEGLLDDVAVQTPTGTQGTALFLGKYLTPRLYLQYGVGLAQSSNVFRIRYELDKHWKIQSETGEYSGGDILFEMEK